MTDKILIDRDTIIRMAREAGGLPDPMVFIGAYERFAALVAAEVGIAQWHRGYAEGQAAEREACAAICDNVQKENEDNGAWLWEAKNCAATIRARKDTP